MGRLPKRPSLFVALIVALQSRECNDLDRLDQSETNGLLSCFAEPEGFAKPGRSATCEGTLSPILWRSRDFLARAGDLVSGQGVVCGPQSPFQQDGDHTPMLPGCVFPSPPLAA